MIQSIDEIAELAEILGNDNSLNGVVDLNEIAKKKNIEIICKNYKDYFIGLLYFENGHFYIHFNLSKVSDINSGRGRFTIGHELGHYFIDKHRKMLQEGISLSFTEKPNDEERIMEREANHFASNLLMPQSLFIERSKLYEPGLEAILSLKDTFRTSLECTANHYINLDLSASIMIKWYANFSFGYASYSSKFGTITGIKGKPPIVFSHNYISSISKIINENVFQFYETAAPLSRWISTVIPKTPKDLLGLEQTIKLGNYGGITLLTFA